MLIRKLVGNIKLVQLLHLSGATADITAHSWSAGNLGNLNHLKLKQMNLNCNACAAALAQPSSLQIHAWAVAMDPLTDVNFSCQNMLNYGNLTLSKTKGE